MSRKKIDVPDSEAKARESARQRALHLALGVYTLWHAQENGPPQGYASFQKSGHTEHVELKASAGRLHLSGLVWKATGEALTRQDLDGALDGLEAAAIHEASFWPAFDHARPRILGALLTALAGALARWDATKPERLPRMSDFFRLILAAEPNMPWAAGKFEAAWKGMEESAVENVLQATPLTSVLMPILEARGRWKASAAELLRVINASRGFGTEPEGWPQTPQGLVGALRRLAPTLEKVGWHIQLGVRDTTNHHGRLVVIVATEAMVERAAIIEHEAGLPQAEAEEQATLEAASLWHPQDQIERLYTQDQGEKSPWKNGGAETAHIRRDESKTA